jgi:V8-like Glu-specific endopeptidase
VSAEPSSGFPRQTSESYAGESSTPAGDPLPELRRRAQPETWPELNTSELQDVAVATFGASPGWELIRGTDDRQRVQNPAAYPWRVNASLQILTPDNKVYLGTGWFVGPRTLITAGHCVYVHDHDGNWAGWASAIRVMPGRDTTNTPYGVVTSTSFRTVVGWARDRDPNFDYAAIILPVPLGDTTGWISTAVREDADLIGAEAWVSGYPGDKTGILDGTQWWDAESIATVDYRKVYYDIDTMGGQSGSAVCILEDEKPVAVGIHAYGQALVGNSATRINPKVFANIASWNSESA